TWRGMHVANGVIWRQLPGARRRSGGRLCRLVVDDRVNCVVSGAARKGLRRGRRLAGRGRLGCFVPGRLVTRRLILVFRFLRVLLAVLVLVVALGDLVLILVLVPLDVLIAVIALDPRAAIGVTALHAARLKVVGVVMASAAALGTGIVGRDAKGDGGDSRA